LEVAIFRGQPRSYFRPRTPIIMDINETLEVVFGCRFITKPPRSMDNHFPWRITSILNCLWSQSQGLSSGSKRIHLYGDTLDNQDGLFLPRRRTHTRQRGSRYLTNNAKFGDGRFSRLLWSSCGARLTRVESNELTRSQINYYY